MQTFIRHTTSKLPINKVADTDSEKAIGNSFITNVLIFKRFENMLLPFRILGHKEIVRNQII